MYKLDNDVLEATV